MPARGALMLTGANGTGKTSLLRLLATLIAPAGGRLLWGDATIGADVAGYRARLRYVGHQDGVKPGLTPRETLAFWAGLQGLARDRARPLRAAGLAALREDAAQRSR